MLCRSIKTQRKCWIWCRAHNEHTSNAPPPEIRFMPNASPPLFSSNICVYCCVSRRLYRSLMLVGWVWVVDWERRERGGRGYVLGGWVCLCVCVYSLLSSTPSRCRYTIALHRLLLVAAGAMVGCPSCYQNLLMLHSVVWCPLDCEDLLRICVYRLLLDRAPAAAWGQQ